MIVQVQLLLTYSQGVHCGTWMVAPLEVIQFSIMSSDSSLTRTGNEDQYCYYGSLADEEVLLWMYLQVHMIYNVDNASTSITRPDQISTW